VALSEYRLRRRVHFYETDVAGIVHFSVFFKYMEEAEHAMWREAGLSIHAVNDDIGWPRLASAFEFYRPLRFEDEFEVQIRVAEMTKKTIRYECTLTKNGEKLASGSMTIACVRKKPTMRAVEIPEDVAQRLCPKS
jgi:YbgC/YbaW family acyl-CoA thioester hydrolase